MKHSHFNLSLLCTAVAALPLVGCIDDNYDLSDIDTTVRVSVNDLEVPVNLDAITLSNIFDLDDESVIKVIGDSYSVLVDGDFNSSGVLVNKVNLGRPKVDEVKAEINTNLTDVPSIPTVTNPLPVSFPIPDVSTEFEFSSNTVDKSILSISGVKADWQITVNLSFSGVSGIIDDVKISDLTLQLPHGLVTPDYTNNNGEINLGTCALTNGSLSKVIRVNAIDFSILDSSEFTFTPSADGSAPGTIFYHGNVGIKSGTMSGTVTSLSNIPSAIEMTLNPELAEIVIDKFSGRLKYAIDNLSVSSVTLNDLPDVLKQESTDIRIANPQLYLSINNPLANYSVDAHSGLKLTPKGDDGVRASQQLPGEILIGHDKGISGPYNICLSPSVPSSYYEGFSNATHYSFPGLSDVLSGTGLPTTIDVDFEDACIGPNDVTDFELGVTLDDVKGVYTFYAPLAFNVGSQIVYEDEDTGWGGDDDTFDKITATKVGVKATVVNNLPFDIELSGWPLDKNGNQCVVPGTTTPVTLTSVTVKGGQECEISLQTNGTLVGIDGIHYCARAIVSEGNETLRPTTTITLTNIRATVSGYYDDEL